MNKQSDSMMFGKYTEADKQFKEFLKTVVILLIIYSVGVILVTWWLGGK